MGYFEPFNISYSSDPVSFEPKELIISRSLSNMSDAFVDQEAVNRILNKSDPEIIKVYMAPIPEKVGHIMSLMTVIYPGTVGEECYMTKGHIHTNLEDAPEVYITIKGEGKLLLQTPEGDTRDMDMLPGQMNYIPSGWAHRAVNCGSDGLIFLGIYTAEAKRDYSFIGIGKENFNKIIVKRDSKVCVIDHPNRVEFGDCDDER